MINFENLGFDNYEEKLEYIIDYLDQNGDISLITNYDTAKALLSLYGDEEVDCYGVNLSDEIDEYLVEIAEDIFMIEPLIRENGFYDIECEEIIIDEEIYDEHEELDEFLYVGSVILLKTNEGCQGICENCDGCEEEIDENCEIIDKYLEEKVQDFIDTLENNENNKDFCFHCALKDVLEQVYCLAYEDGKKELAFSLGDLLSDIQNT